MWSRGLRQPPQHFTPLFFLRGSSAGPIKNPRKIMVAVKQPANFPPVRPPSPSASRLQKGGKGFYNLLRPDLPRAASHVRGYGFTRAEETDSLLPPRQRRRAKFRLDVFADLRAVQVNSPPFPSFYVGRFLHPFLERPPFLSLRPSLSHPGVHTHTLLLRKIFFSL